MIAKERSQQTFDLARNISHLIGIAGISTMAFGCFDLLISEDQLKAEVIKNYPSRYQTSEMKAAHRTMTTAIRQGMLFDENMQTSKDTEILNAQLVLKEVNETQMKRNSYKKELIDQPNTPFSEYTSRMNRNKIMIAGGILTTLVSSAMFNHSVYRRR